MKGTVEFSIENSFLEAYKFARSKGIIKIDEKIINSLYSRDNLNKKVSRSDFNLDSLINAMYINNLITKEQRAILIFVYLFQG